MAAPSVDPEEQWDEGFPTVNHPNLPFVGPIPGGISPGKTIQVKGQINKNATKFSINLQCGENSLPYADAAFNFSPQFDEIVVRNTRVDGEWGMEEKNQPCIPIPFVRGESFELIIQCEHDRYKLHVNGKHFIDYKFRSRLEDVDSVSFKKDVEIKAIRFGQGSLTNFINTVGNGTMDNNSVENNHATLQNTPFAQAVKDTLRPGSLIYIKGYIPVDAQVFSLNLQQGDKTIPSVNVSLHINPRFSSFVTRNTMVDEMWGTAETEADIFPFVRGGEFDVKVQCRSTGYKVWVGSRPFTDYRHRIEDFNRINCISIEGNIEVASIIYTQETPDQEALEAQATEDQIATENIPLECTSVSSADDKQSIDSTNPSSSVKDEEAMDDEEAPSEEQETTQGEGAVRSSEASPSESALADDSASEQEPMEASNTEENNSEESNSAEAKTETTSGHTEATNMDENNSKESNSAVAKTETKTSPLKEDNADGEPQSKKKKLNENDGDGKQDEQGDEEEEDEEDEGAESDDSEKKDGDFDVERILTRRKGPDGDEYLLKWAGWPLYDCTWEPEANVSKGVRRAFNKPAITKARLVTSADIFYESIHAHLTGSKGSDQMRLRIEHDVLRNILSDKGRPQDKSDPNGWRIYNKSDLQEWGLPDNWWYRLDKKGHGKQVSFPIRMKIQLDWTPLSYMADKHRKLIPAKRKPLELLLVQMKKRDYSI